MRAVCPAGHISAILLDGDDCPICGSPVAVQHDEPDLAATRVFAAPPTAPATVVLPAVLAPEPVAPPAAGHGTGSWEADIWVDPAWYQGQQTTHQLPSVSTPTRVRLDSYPLLIGRRSQRQDLHPDLDLSSDPGVSRRHAELSIGSAIGQPGELAASWFLRDLGSSNGTFLTGADGPLPEVPLQPDHWVPIGTQTRIFLGAWTRISLRSLD